MSKPSRLESVVGEQTYFHYTPTDGREGYFIYLKCAELFIDTFYRYREQARLLTSVAKEGFLIFPDGTAEADALPYSNPSQN